MWRTRHAILATVMVIALSLNSVPASAGECRTFGAPPSSVPGVTPICDENGLLTSIYFDSASLTIEQRSAAITSDGDSVFGFNGWIAATGYFEFLNLYIENQQGILTDVIQIGQGVPNVDGTVEIGVLLRTWNPFQGPFPIANSIGTFVSSPGWHSLSYFWPPIMPFDIWYRGSIPEPSTLQIAALAMFLLVVTLRRRV